MRIVLTVIFLSLTHLSNAQLKKGGFLLGINGGFARDKSDQKSPSFVLDTKQTQFFAEPRAGYFIMDQLAVGLRFSMQHLRQDQYVYSVLPGMTVESAEDNKATQWAVGPFARYYLMPGGKKWNLFSEVAWTYGGEKASEVKSTVNTPTMGFPVFTSSSTTTRYNVSTFYLSAGPAFFISDKVSFEISLGYAMANAKGEDRKNIQAATGFLIFLK